MIYFVIVLSVLLFLTLLYFLVFIRPDGNIPSNKVLNSEYAHRGYYDNETIPENSLHSFEHAIKNGWGFEFDIQLSKDGEVMVFHDYSLKRMTGVDKKLCELDCKELKKLKLLGKDQTIPTLAEVLELVDGKVPLLIELKGENLNSELCEKAAPILKGYCGDYCIESFNPLLLLKIKKLLPNAVRGQLYTNVCRDKKKCSVLNIFLTAMIFNFLAAPHFIAYNKLDRKSLPILITTKLYKAPHFVWTIKGKNELTEAREKNEFAIFEDIK